MLVLCYNDARRHCCWLMQIVKRKSNAAKRYDVCLMLTISGSLTRRYFKVQPPINTQNDGVYAAASKKSSVASRHLVKGCEHFSESRMVSVAVSKTGKTSVHFVEKVTKVDASYYRETLLQRCLFSEIHQKSADHLVFQQDGAPSHRAKSSSFSVPYRTSLNHLYGPQQPGL